MSLNKINNKSIFIDSGPHWSDSAGRTFCKVRFQGDLNLEAEQPAFPHSLKTPDDGGRREKALYSPQNRRQRAITRTMRNII